MSCGANQTRNAATVLEPGKRAKSALKACAKCGTGIPLRKTWCGPCYDGRLSETKAANRQKRQPRQAQNVTEPQA